jgi:1,4-alpha-glucan branching enzyme
MVVHHGCPGSPEREVAMKRVRFSIEAPKAKKVMLAADFTDWEARAKAMRKEKAGSRTFAATVNLPPGTYQYRFIVDGEWVDDRPRRQPLRLAELPPDRLRVAPQARRGPRPIACLDRR